MSEKTKQGLHIAANPQRLKVEEIRHEIEHAKTTSAPSEVSLELIYQQQQKILEQNAYIIHLLQKRP